MPRGGWPRSCPSDSRRRSHFETVLESDRVGDRCQFCWPDVGLVGVTFCLFAVCPYQSPCRSVSVLEPALNNPVEPDVRPVPRRRLHPAWVMLAMGTAGMFLSAPGQSFSVAAFIDPMLGDLGIGRTWYSVAYLCAGLCGGIVLPGIGLLLDRLGARLMLPLLGVLLGAACLWMSSIKSLAGLCVGFTMIRCIGQGALTLSATWLVGEWFQQRRGLAMGIVGLGGAVSVMTIPQINDALISEFGWRVAWSSLAGMVWVGLVLPALLLVRDRPEPLGLFPDGRWTEDPVAGPDAGESSSSASGGNFRDMSFGVRDALALSSFWKLLAVWCTTAMVGTGLIFHQVDLLRAHGIPRNQALWLLGLQAMVATVTGVWAGILTDRGHERYLLAASMLFLGSGVGLVLWLPSPGWVVLYGGLLGLQGGIIRTAGTAVWINYYGRTNQGAIRGVAMAAAVVAAAVGPLPLALSLDLTGSYATALAVFAVIPLVSGLLVLTAHRPVGEPLAPMTMPSPTGSEAAST
ncbi:MAG: hypothetical protein CMJ65_04160 [Planctomycetaceae bacterium]|nr:hypothetical protein [Planctomycetaceae bacterium]